jgi:2-iminobutanoate/2-iminopropanoate deaminase
MTLKHVVVDGMPRLAAFSHAVIAGDFIYVSGCLGTDPDTGELAPGGTGPQTAQTLRNIERILRACDATLDDVVKMGVFLADMGTFGDMNEAYIPIIGENPPARITVGRADLARGAAVEIDAVAYNPRS